MADNLESYFKKHLSEEEPKAEGWNEPSEDIWGKVRPEIQKKRGIFIPWRYIYILGIVLVGLTVLLWYRSSRNDQSVTEKSYQERQPAQVLQPDDQTAASNKSINSNKADKAEPVADLIQAEQRGDAEDPIKKSIVADPAKTKTKETVAASDDYLLGLTGDRSVDEPTQERPEDQLVIGRLSPRSVKYPGLTADDTMLQINKPDDTIPPLQLSKTKAPIINKGKFAIGAYFAPTFTSTFLQGDPGTSQIETGNMFLYSSSWGFEIRYFVSNRFSLVAGIERSQVKSWSRSASDFGYDTSTEHLMPSGEKENTSPVGMPTPFGRVDTELTYRFSGDDEIADGEQMNSVFETHQELGYLTIPLGTEFNIIRFSRFDWFAEGGLRYNHALQDATTFTSRVIHAGEDMNVVGEEMRSHPTYTRNYLDYYLGTGLNYQFSERFLISGSARYFRNMTRVNLQENLSTQVRGFNLTIGLTYIF